MNKARTRAESDLAPGGRRESADNYSATSYVQKTRLRELRPSLGNLQITQLLNEHMALVKHMQFSPNGDFLATCRFVDVIFSERQLKTDLLTS